MVDQDYILFTKGNHWWSDVICSVLAEPVSHVSVLRGDTVYHSDLLGVRHEPLSKFLERQEKVIYVSVGRIGNLEYKYAKYSHYQYDILSMLFIGLSFLTRRFLGIPLPKSNLWNITGMYICTEWVTSVLGKVDSMITPWGLYKKLTEN